MATAKLNVRKVTQFEVDGVNHNFYNCTYKGRFFGVSTIQWVGEEESLSFDEEAKILSITVDVEVLPSNGKPDAVTGEVRTFANLVPKCDFTIAAF